MQGVTRRIAINRSRGPGCLRDGPGLLLFCFIVLSAQASSKAGGFANNQIASANNQTASANNQTASDDSQ